jgi:hypothetical protein
MTSTAARLLSFALTLAFLAALCLILLYYSG